MATEISSNSIGGIDFRALLAPPPAAFWEENPPSSPLCFERIRIRLRAQINGLTKSHRLALRNYLQVKKLVPASIPDPEKQRLFQEAFQCVIDVVKNGKWFQDPRDLRVPKVQAYRLPTMSTDDFCKLRLIYLSPNTALSSVHQIHRHWCVMEPRTFSEYLIHADLISEMRQRSSRARPQMKHSLAERTASKHSWEKKYLGRELGDVYNMYEQWLQIPRTREEYIDHADVICHIEARQFDRLDDDFDDPLDPGERAENRDRLRRRYSKMTSQKMHQEHSLWCREEVHRHEEYLDHAIVVTELDLKSRNPVQDINPEERQQRTPEQSVEFRQMYWNRYHDKPIEDIYWDREHWLQGVPHTVEEYIDHQEIVREMQNRPNQPALAVATTKTTLDHSEEAPPTSRHPGHHAKSPNSTGVGRQSSRTSQSTRDPLAPTTSQQGAGITKPRTRRKKCAASTPAIANGGRSAKGKGSAQAGSKRGPARLPPPPLTAFERSMLDKDGWRWYPTAAPLFPFAETRYIAAIMNINTKIDLAFGPGTSDLLPNASSFRDCGLMLSQARLTSQQRMQRSDMLMRVLRRSL